MAHAPKVQASTIYPLTYSYAVFGACSFLVAPWSVVCIFAAPLRRFFYCLLLLCCFHFAVCEFHHVSLSLCRRVDPSRCWMGCGVTLRARPFVCLSECLFFSKGPSRSLVSSLLTI